MKILILILCFISKLLSYPRPGVRIAEKEPLMDEVEHNV